MTDDNDDNNEREDDESTEDANGDDCADVHLTGIIPVERATFLDIP